MNLVWFRQDLRVSDQTALWYASQQDSVIALVYISRKQWQIHNDAPIKIDFYLRQLQQLKSELSKLNIPLIIRETETWAEIPDDLLKISQTLNIKQIHANIDLGVNELDRDCKVQQLLEKNKITVEFYQDRTLFPVGSIRNKTDQPYQVFSAFKRNCHELLNISLPQCYPPIETQSPFDLTKKYSTEIPSVQTFFPDYKPQYDWPVGEAYAQNVLNEFIENELTEYKDQRDFPAISGTSQLSPYLNLGMISIRQCIEALFREQNGYFQLENIGQQTWLDELIWREFYQHILYDHPKLSKHQPYKSNTLAIPWRTSDQDLEAWKYGQTGIPIVDAGIRQMLATGWMHNRVRMIVAMFLTKNLLIDWRLGEQWFMQNLIDGDLAANNGGWQWCASTGTDSVPYFRIFNPISQSKKFDPNGDYIRQWIPELSHLDAKQIHEPYAANIEDQLDYPKPIVDLKESRLRALAAFKGD